MSLRGRFGSGPGAYAGRVFSTRSTDVGQKTLEKNPADLADLERSLGYAFADRQKLVLALTHAGAAKGRNASYQRLEFLGDRVLGVVVAEMLYDAFPDAEEGELSRRLADLVRKESCAGVASGWGLGPYIQFAKGEKSTAALRDAILGDLCESVIGAVFLDGGYNPARALVERFFKESMHSPQRPLRDSKTTLQEWAQGKSLPTPVYREIVRTGPDHAPLFTIAVVIEGYPEAASTGASKRTAEQAAAAAFLARENLTPAPRPT